MRRGESRRGARQRRSLRRWQDRAALDMGRRRGRKVVRAAHLTEDKGGHSSVAASCPPCWTCRPERGVVVDSAALLLKIAFCNNFPSRRAKRLTSYYSAAAGRCQFLSSRSIFFTLPSKQQQRTPSRPGRQSHSSVTPATAQVSPALLLSGSYRVMVIAQPPRRRRVVTALLSLCRWRAAVSAKSLRWYRAVIEQPPRSHGVVATAPLLLGDVRQPPHSHHAVTT